MMKYVVKWLYYFPRLNRQEIAETPLQQFVKVVRKDSVIELFFLSYYLIMDRNPNKLGRIISFFYTQSF
jgi:hypothetical protein